MYEESDVEERIDRLESLLGNFIVGTDSALKRLEREMRTFKNEMRIFKDEMTVFKDEMGDFKNEMGDFKDEMSDFKDEMSDFKNEMQSFKNEMRQDRREMNIQWGNLANKMGTIVEDIVAPAVRPAVQKYFHQDIDHFSIRVKRKNKRLGLKGEFDVIAANEENVFLVEVKSSPNEEYLNQFIEKKIPVFVKLFPEYEGKRIIPIFAGLRFDGELVKLASAGNVYVLAYREWDYMDILNFGDVKNSA